MPKNVTPYRNSEKGKKGQVTEMFNTISGNYDRLNRVISFGLDVGWRKKIVRYLKKKSPDTVIDIATGTGDLAIEMVKTGASEIIGLDIARGMLQIGEEKLRKKNLEGRVKMVEGDSENLPFDAEYFDAATVAFGVRNFEDLEKGLSEIYRVLKTGGHLLILETSVPSKSPFKQFYRFYTKNILPAIGRLFSKDRSAYRYLSESAAVFPHGEAFGNILTKIGFIEVENRPQFFGVATIYIAVK